MNPYTGEIVNIPEGHVVPEHLVPIPAEELEEVKIMSFKEKMKWVKRRALK